MHYKQIYESVITRAKTRELEGYSEQHHIIPRCMGGTDAKENLVYLTAREHFICHQLLIKIYPGNVKLIFAAAAMARLRGDDRVGCREYSWLKLKISEARKTGAFITCMCGVKVWKRPHQNRVGTRGKYCSRDCSYKFRQPCKPRTGSVKMCEYCKTEFYCSPSVLQKFCSVKCKGKSTPTRNQKIINCTCSACGIIFDRPACRVKDKRNIFCNNQCRLKYTSKVLSMCLICNSTFSRYKYAEGRKYCSMSCYWQSKKIPI
jgi:hypothetical protein